MGPSPRPPRRTGADAVSLINTAARHGARPARRPPLARGRTGGVSGPAVRAVALAQVADVARRVAIPIVGMGGVQSGRDSHELIAVGATLVAVGTESFRDPAAGARIAAELAGLPERAGSRPGRLSGFRHEAAQNACKRAKSQVKQPRHASTSA